MTSNIIKWNEFKFDVSNIKDYVVFVDKNNYLHVMNKQTFSDIRIWKNVVLDKVTYLIYKDDETPCYCFAEVTDFNVILNQLI